MSIKPTIWKDLVQGQVAAKLELKSLSREALHFLAKGFVDKELEEQGFILGCGKRSLPMSHT
jgi:hypothetical protein